MRRAKRMGITPLALRCKEARAAGLSGQDDMHRLLLQQFQELDVDREGLLYMKTVKRVLAEELPKVIRLDAGEVDFLLHALDPSMTEHVDYKQLLQVMRDYLMLPELELVNPIFRDPKQAIKPGDGSNAGSRAGRVRSAAARHARSLSREGRVSYQERSSGRLHAPRELTHSARLEPLSRHAPLVPREAFPEVTTPERRQGGLPPTSPVAGMSGELHTQRSGSLEGKEGENLVPLPRTAASDLGGGWLSPMRRSHSAEDAAQLSAEASRTANQVAQPPGRYQAFNPSASMPNVSRSLAEEMASMASGHARPLPSAPDRERHVPFWGVDMLGQAHKAELTKKLTEAASGAAAAATPSSASGSLVRASALVRNDSSLTLPQQASLESGGSLDDLEVSLTGMSLTAPARARQLGPGLQNVAGLAGSKGVLFGKTRAEAFLTHLRTGVDTLGRKIMRNLSSMSHPEQSPRQRSPAVEQDSPASKSPESPAQKLSEEALAIVQQHTAAREAYAETSTAVPLRPQALEGAQRLAALTRRIERSVCAVAMLVWAEHTDSMRAREQRVFVAKFRGAERFARVLRKLFLRRVGPPFMLWLHRAKPAIDSLRNAAASSIQAAARGHLVRRRLQREKEARGASALQSVVRMHLARKDYIPRRDEERAHRSATRIQAAVRGRQGRANAQKLAVELKRERAALSIQAVARGRKARRRAKVYQRMAREVKETQRSIAEAREHAMRHRDKAKAAKKELEMFISASRDRRKAELEAKAAADASRAAAKARTGQESITRQALRQAERIAKERLALEEQEAELAKKAVQAAKEARDSAVALLARRKRAEVRHVAALRIQGRWREHKQHTLERLKLTLSLGSTTDAGLQRTLLAQAETDVVTRKAAQKVADAAKALKLAGEVLQEHSAADSESKGEQQQPLSRRQVAIRDETVRVGAGTVEALSATLRSLAKAVRLERKAAQDQIAQLQAAELHAGRQVEQAIAETLRDPIGMAAKLEAGTAGELRVRKYQSALAREYSKRRRRAKRFGKRQLRWRRQTEPWDYGFVAARGTNVPPQRKWVKFYEPAADALYYVSTTTLERRWIRPTQAEGYETSDSEASDDEVGQAPWAAGTSKRPGEAFAGEGFVKTMDPAVVAAQNARWKAYACAECAAARSTRRCDVCAEAYCDRCFALLHKRGKRTMHTWKAVRPWNPVEQPGNLLRKDACSECRVAPGTRRCVQCNDEFCGTCFELTHRSDALKSKHAWVETEAGKQQTLASERKGLGGVELSVAPSPAEVAEEDVQGDEGYYDEHGGYVDADGGYTDAEGGYTDAEGTYYPPEA